MLVKNTFDGMVLGVSYFLPEHHSEEIKQKVLDMFGATDLSEKITLNFSLGGVIFDLIRQSVELGLFPAPASPKLLYNQEKLFSMFAQNADAEGEIDVPEKWLPFIDQILSDDELFCKATIYGEITTPSGEKKGAIPMQARVVNALPQICTALLKILPQ